jgi:hypothetical protein
VPAALSLRVSAVVVSSRDLRKYSETSAAAAPIPNGMRQAPRFQFIGAQDLLQHDQHQESRQLAADQRHVLERRE